MDKCINCKKNNGEIEYKVLEVHNTRHRDPKGLAFKTQELCGFRTFSVCSECIDKKLHLIMDRKAGAVESLKYSFILMIMGIAFIIKFYSSDKVYTVFGALMVIVFFYKAYDFAKTSKTKKEVYSKYSETNARFVAGWECIGQAVPRTQGDSRVNFIPVTKASSEMKRDDFVRFYGLTRDNANKLYEMIHNEKSPEELQEIEDNQSDPVIELTEEELKD